MKGFRDFIMQGNVIDLAVGVVIGSAFTALVGAFVTYVITPILSVFNTGGIAGFGPRIIRDNPATQINIGMLLSAVITFLITAAVVYFVFVAPMAKARQMARVRKGLPAVEEDPVAEDIALLTEIRDLLAGDQRHPQTGTPRVNE
ncbi:large conductance mechanosensitive channel protein MscL [Helcobacillus massiliensis]|uniref:Large conductance mechanosensitive channel n=1 Tax=Helcobacillus massiliensis TaxID=521392 RepID=A0A839QQ70_9MICO|nr:large conductance mechanosensitive channel protein MscL [Helcobacillus massiliensis]MBB3022643.1 large conductance mechanosensitive channel [Helcobacillus massiliensis]